VRYRARIKSLIDNPPTIAKRKGSETEIHAHWAKYACVLISGFIEQALKEVVLEYAESKAAPQIRNHIEHTWPKSRNMRSDVIQRTLEGLDKGWSKKHEEWSNENQRKKEINEIITWRNDIVHGKESNLNSITLVSVKDKFKVACDLVDFIEDLLGVRTK